jgi:hypothetical protein
MPRGEKRQKKISSRPLAGAALHRVARAANAPRRGAHHGAHDAPRDVRRLVDHEAELALVDRR